MRIAFRRAALRREKDGTDDGPQRCLYHRCKRDGEARKHTASDDSYQKFKSMRYGKHGKYLNGLREHAEPNQASVDDKRHEAQQRVGQRMLSKHGGLLHIHQQAHEKC